MKSINGQRVISVLLSITVLIACLSAVTLANSPVSAEGVGFSDDFESGLKWELKSGTPSDGEELNTDGDENGRYLTVPSGASAFYSPKSSEWKNSGQKVYFKTDMNLKNTNSANRFSLVYWYKDANNWKALQFYKNEESKYQALSLCMTEGIAVTKNSSKSQAISCWVDPVFNGQKMIAKNDGDEWITLEFILESSQTFRIKLTRAGESDEYTAFSTPSSGYTMAYRVGGSTVLNDAERKAAVFDAFDMRKDGFAIAQMGNNNRAGYIDNFVLRCVTESEDSDSLIAKLLSEEYSDVLSLTADTVKLSDKARVEEAITEFNKLTENQRSFAGDDITPSDRRS